MKDNCRVKRIPDPMEAQITNYFSSPMCSGEPVELASARLPGVRRHHDPRLRSRTVGNFELSILRYTTCWLAVRLFSHTSMYSIDMHGAPSFEPDP